MILPVASSAAWPEMALGALQRGQLLNAYFAADRWIRLAGANANNLWLRAEVAHRLGVIDAAVDDLKRGLQNDPLHRLLNRRLAEWAKGAERIDAARALTTLSRRDAETGLKILADVGEIGAGAVRIEDGLVIGWLAWRADRPAWLRLPGEAPEIRVLTADPKHPSAAIFGAAVDIRLPFPAAPSRRVSLFVDGQAIASARAPDALSWADEEPIGGPETALTVVVPVYGDYESTRDCLLSVAAEVAATANSQALVIEDETPEPRIRALLARFAGRPHWRVLANPGNLGFVATVNRGLRRLKHGDVLVLNADTRLPERALARLSSAARSQRNVGIVNPLSNHGEFVSYPRPFRRNAFDEKGWVAIDLAAARCGEGRVIDIPSATGFCMYVTRACLDAVGGLSEAFGDGYLEDADFGLRAREAGFRNVCALSVYAPHLGSRSFKSAKKALVARNRVALARRFPEYEAECDAFLAADPLAHSRARLEMALASESPKRRLIVGPARWRDACDLRADQLAAEGVGALVALVEGQRMTMRGHDDAAPQNVEIEFARDGAVLADALKAWPFDRIEYFWAPDAPAALRQALDSDLGPLDIVLAIPPLSARDIHAWPRCEKILAFDAMAARACQALGAPAPRLAPRMREAAGAPRRIDLAILHPFETSQSRRFLIACADALAQRRQMALLIGGSSAEERLIAAGLFATGPVRRADWPRLLEVYAPRRYVSPYRDEGFWAIEHARALFPAPAAFFDPTRSGFRPGVDDLPLDADSEDAATIAALLAWAFPRGAKRAPDWERVAA